MVPECCLERSTVSSCIWMKGVGRRPRSSVQITVLSQVAWVGLRSKFSGACIGGLLHTST